MNSEHDAKWMRNWQDLAGPALGAWLLVSPWALRFAATNNAAAEAAWIAGTALFAASLMNSVSLRFSQGIGECVVGICLMISPWELDYAAAFVPAANALIVGLLLVLFSLSIDWREDGSTKGCTHIEQQDRKRAADIHQGRGHA